MSWSNLKGFNFRQTLAFVTDGTNETFVNVSFGSYPQSKTVDGDTFNCGWETAPSTHSDENAGLDRRLAGSNAVSSGGTEAIFRIDLPNTGNYVLRAAFGDAGFAGPVKGAVRDTTTDVITIVETSLNAEEFIDASLVKRTSAANWVTNQVEVTKTFSTTILRIAISVPATPSSSLAHFAIRSAGVIPSTGAYQQEQSSTDRYQLEDGSGVYLIEPWGQTGVFLPPFIQGDLTGIGTPGRFFKDRLN